MSIVIAILADPWIAMKVIIPYLTLLIAFGSFVLWNGGVVLGKLISVFFFFVSLPRPGLLQYFCFFHSQLFISPVK